MEKLLFRRTAVSWHFPCIARVSVLEDMFFGSQLCFCLSKIYLIAHYLFVSLAIHLSMLGYNIGNNSKFIFLLYFTRCFSRNLMGPLSGVVPIDGHVSLW